MTFSYIPMHFMFLYKVFWSYTKPSGLIQSLLVCTESSGALVYIVDYDAFSLNDPVDEITIPLSKADGEFSPSMTYYGVCERASLTVQFRITSECPSNRYGPQCTKECVGVQRITFCNYIGDTIDLCPYGTDWVCEGNFLEPNCILCDENYYPPDLCNVQCIPQDNSFGHYTCDPESGDRVCLEGYTDPSTFCVEENEGKGYLLLRYFFLVPIMQMQGQAPLRELLQQFRLF